MTATTQSDAPASAREIREHLGHPMVDGDGHLVEIREVFRRYVCDRGWGRYFDDPLARGLFVPGNEQTFTQPLEVRQREFLRAEAGWFTPGNTKDYASVTMPGLMYERLPETGFDFSVVYPTYGLFMHHIATDETRRGLCRLYNEMVAEDYAPYRDRMSPVAVIPLNSPEEGIEALDHAVSIGLKAFLIPSFVWRTIPAYRDAPAQYRARLRRIDTFGLDSEYDYDPFWKRATELNAPLSTHTPAYAMLDRTSPTNYVYCHPGMFAATGEALAKSLFLGGVLKRFPSLRVALLEGGVAVGVRLYDDLVSRYEKRGPEGLQTLDPRQLDVDALAEYAQRYHLRAAGLPRDLLIPQLALEEGERDDFALSGARSTGDIRDQFCRGLYWGCEGDDPLVAVAFDERVNPLGAVIPSFVGSDIGHWDVPNFDHPLQEAYEQIEHGLLTKEQFEMFTFSNAVRFYAGDRPDFFAGTAVEAAATAVINTTGTRA